MGELLAKYTEIVKPNEDRTSTVPESTEAIENIPTKKALPVSHAPNTKEAPQSSPARTRGTKRTRYTSIAPDPV